MRRFLLASLVLAAACSREVPAPSQTASQPPDTVPPPPAASTATPMPQLQKGTYDEALLWFRSAAGFRFVLEDHGIRAEGEMERSTPGREKVQFRAGGSEWLAEASPRGVAWKRRDGASWTSVEAPEFGPRIYQRVTVAFDPQKKEGVPLLVSQEGDTNLYRFTDANTGQVHELWVAKADARVERIKVGETVDLRITQK